MQPSVDRIKELLQKHLRFYLSLRSGKCKPTTDAQKHFVLLTQRKTAPVGDHEWAYLAFARHEYEKNKASCLRQQQEQERIEQKEKSELSQKKDNADDPWFGSPYWESGVINKQPNQEEWDLRPSGSVDDQEDFADDHLDWEDIEKRQNEKQEP
jgi:uncharacterized protein YifE (UPF0438 family)